MRETCIACAFLRRRFVLQSSLAAMIGASLSFTYFVCCSPQPCHDSVQASVVFATTTTALTGARQSLCLVTLVLQIRDLSLFDVS